MIFQTFQQSIRNINDNFDPAVLQFIQNTQIDIGYCTAGSFARKDQNISFFQYIQFLYQCFDILFLNFRPFSVDLCFLIRKDFDIDTGISFFQISEVTLYPSVLQLSFDLFTGKTRCKTQGSIFMPQVFQND